MSKKPREGEGFSYIVYGTPVTISVNFLVC